MFAQKVPEFDLEEERVQKLSEQLTSLAETELQKSEYKDIPIIFSVNDIAPKNTLVNRGNLYL